MNSKKNNSVPLFDSLALVMGQLSLLDLLANGVSTEDLAWQARKLLEKRYNNKDHKSLTMGINDSCNLSCRHCYYAGTQDKTSKIKENLLDEHDWQTIIEDALLQGITQFSISGKEPLLNPKLTLAMLQVLEGRRKDFPHLGYELRTNGTMMDRFSRQLQNYQYSPLVISFDGSKEAHDSIRGNGSYDKAKNGVRYAMEKGISNIAVTFTAMPSNVDSIDEMIDDLYAIGIREFGIGMCFHTSYHKSQIADIDVLYKAKEKVKSMGSKSKFSDISIAIHLSGRDHPELIAKMYARGDIIYNNIIVPNQIIPRLLIALDGNKSMLNIEILPTAFYNKLRIECDGAVSGDYKMLTSPQERVGFTNVRRYKKNPITKIWRKAEQEWVGKSEDYYQGLVKEFKEKV